MAEARGPAGDEGEGGWGGGRKDRTKEGAIGEREGEEVKGKKKGAEGREEFKEK